MPTHCSIGSSPRSRLCVATLAAVAALTVAPRAASAELDHAYQSWLLLNVEGPIARGFRVVSDLQYRAYPDFTPVAVLVRPGIGYQILPGLIVAAGYAFTPSWASAGADRFTSEHRLWEQLVYRVTAAGSGVGFESRTRLEERFREPADTVEVGLRLRQLLRLSVPLADARRLQLFVRDELFFALNRAGESFTGGLPTPRWQTAGFDQNRLFVGLSYQVIPTVLRVELGYLNQFLLRATRPTDLMNHVAHAALWFGW